MLGLDYGGIKVRKLLVTGASGFIGSNLVARLLEEDYQVIGMDNDKKKSYLLRKVEKHPNFLMIWDDINNIDNHTAVLNGIDEVYHLAASADIRQSYQVPTMDLKNNVQGTNAVLEYIRKAGIKRLIFSSSSSIYGVTNVTPTPEDVSDIRPISMYGASKLANEAFIHAYNDLYGIRAWMFRFANVVGFHQHRGVIYDLYHKLRKNKEELEVLGDGKQLKSYFDVSDCVNGLIEIPRQDHNNSVEIYNLGNNHTMSVKDLANVLCERMKVSPLMKFTGGDRGWPGDTPYTILSIDKALSVGWKPNYTCKQSINRTIDWLEQSSK